MLNKIDNVFGSHGEFAFARARENERVLGIKPVMHDLRFDRVGVGRERRIFHQNFKARFGRPIKRGHHQVQIHRQAVHANHFDWLCADEPRGRLAQRFVIRIPWRLRFEMRVDAELRPIVEFLIYNLPGRFWHQA